MRWHSHASTEYRKADNAYVRNLFQFLASAFTLLLLHSRLYLHYQFQGELTFNKMQAFTKINSQKCRATNS